MMPDENNPIWEVGYVNSDGVKETPKPYMYFREYLKLGAGRSLSKLHDNIYKTYTKDIHKKAPSYNSLRQYCHKFDWVERAKAYDNYLQKKYLDSTIQNQSEINYLRGKIEKKRLKEFDSIDEQILNVVKVLVNNIHDSYKLLSKGKITQRDFTQAIKHDVLCIVKLYKCAFKSSEHNHDAIWDYVNYNVNKENEININLNNNDSTDILDRDELLKILGGDEDLLDEIASHNCDLQQALNNDKMKTY